MKKSLFFTAMVVCFGLMSLASAAPTRVRGYIMDSHCAGNKAMKGNAACNKSCIAHGSYAVLVVDRTNKVLKVANAAKISGVIGEHVIVTGTVAKGEITVDTAKALPARAKKKAA